MARIRSVKPELRRSLTVSSWKRETRYAWVLLWGYLDDYGYGVDDLRLITSDLFPLDRDVTERKINSWLNEMTLPGVDGEDGALCRFEVKGRRYLHAIKWSEHQKPAHPTASRYPACPIHGPTKWPGKPPQTTVPEQPAIPEDFTNPSGEIPEPLANHSGAFLLAPAETGDGRREVETGAGETGDGSSPTSDGPSSELTQPREQRTIAKKEIPTTGEPWIDDLTAAVLRQRPAWSPGLIIAAIKRASKRAGPQRVSVALMCVAAAEDSKTPHRVISDGWWWDENDSRYLKALERIEVAA